MNGTLRDPLFPDPSGPRSPWPLVLLTVALVFLGFMVLGGWDVFGGRPRLHDEDALPRPVTPRGDLAEAEKQIIDIFRRAAPSVVFITTLERRRSIFSLRPLEIPQGTGSGFIWDEDGAIVTNFHVIRSADSCTVTLADHTTHRAWFVGGDPAKDLAVLRIDASGLDLKPLPIGSSSDLLVGQTVLAIGNPFGLDQTLTTGIISGLDREIRSVGNRVIRGVIQTDAAINPGNSGGPLLDSAGRLIGVNTAIYSPSGAYAGIGFAVPVDTVNKIVPRIIRGASRSGTSQAGLGVYLVRSVQTRRLGFPGVMIESVVPGGAAEKAGLRGVGKNEAGEMVPGDLILAVDGKEVAEEDDVRALILEKEVGDVVRLKIMRGRRVFEVDVTLQALR